MIQKNLYEIYPVLLKLKNCTLPAVQAYGIYKLLEALTPHFNFGIEQEKKIIEKYNAVINSDGSINIEKTEEPNALIHELEELHTLDVDVSLVKPQISISAIHNINMTPADFKSLENIVEFVD